MKPYTHLQIALWCLTTLMQAGIATAIFRKQLVREMPVFFGYNVFHVVQALVAMIAYSIGYRTYFYVYWGTEAIDALVVLLVIQEIFGNVLRPYDALRSLGLTLFRGALLVLVIIAITMAARYSGSWGTPLLRGLLVLEQSTLFVQAGLILFLILFARLFGLSWRNYVFGVSLGFGVMACVSGVAAALITHLGAEGHDFLREMMGNGFNFAILVWIYYLLAPGSSREVNHEALEVSPLKAWNRALEGILNR